MKNIKELTKQRQVELEKAYRANGKGVAWYEKSFTQIPNKVILDDSLSVGAFKVLVVLYMHDFGSGSCFPGQPLIAREIGLKGKNGRIAVIRHLKVLEKKGYVRIKERKGSSNIYHLLIKVRGP